jgi:hypothetical protein
LYQPASGATVIRTYDETKYIPSNTDIGKITYVFNGGMTVNYMSLIVMGMRVSTEDVDFPIPYNTDIVLENGNYFPGKLKLMPGATLRVESDANLIVDKTLYVLDGLIQSDMSGKSYPSTETLQSAGFSASGQLFVNGAMTVKQGAIFGGVIQTCAEGDAATVTIEQGAIVNKTGIRDGAVGEYDVNTSIFDLPARAYIFNSVIETYELKQLYSARVYSSYEAVTWTIDSYDMTYAENCTEEERSPDIPERSGKYHKWTTATVPLNEDRIGSWGTEHFYYDVNVINSTVYDAQDATRTAVSGENTPGEVIEGGNIVFTVATTGAGKGYVYQVSYVSGDAEPIVLTPDAEGNYTISNVEDDVTITVTSCILGDVNLNGAINTLDLLTLRRIIAGYISPTPLQNLTSNTNRDLAGRVNTLDLLQLRKYIAGYLSVL